jgi:hypothetical protein
MIAAPLMNEADCLARQLRTKTPPQRTTTAAPERLPRERLSPLSRDPPALAGFDAITVAVQVPNEHESDSSASASWSRQWRFT